MAEKKKKGIGNRVAISIVIVALIAVAVFVPVSEDGSLVSILLASQEPEPEPIACILIFAPVCGVNGETFSNSCFAEAEGVEIAHEGECVAGSNTGEMLVSEPTSGFCTIYPTFPQCQ
ncbi:MAG: Kazal-type serine protease inhibitor [Patescibacteria group bacterium]|nr:Kazal-type serine protease inhibitor [Patescibacteria group bacterium]